MSATELAQLIRDREASSVEVVQAHLRRIEAVDPSVNAVVLVLGEQALQAARSADRAVVEGAELPTLHGVPFTVKEIIDVAGTPTTQGFKAFASAYPTRALTSELPFMTRHAILRGWEEFQQTYPLIVGPVATEVPSLAGTDLDEGQVAERIRTMRLTMAVNALGLPAVALPVGIAEGLPQAVQVIGSPYREDVCLDAAAVIEDALGIFTPIDPR
jgi:Asp-tRNA(Asn)/Glu-tRNA(Gln) amidotransferase A subunit family amidase